ATPADRGAANINYERKPLAVPGTWNPGTNYADSRYQLPQIDTLLRHSFRKETFGSLANIQSKTRAQIGI
ncbi:Fic family protein, partial [Corynebacterium striatum]